MSIIGTRPPLISETNLYELHHMDVHGEFDTIEPLQATGDPFDPFALQKACLLACGIIPQKGYKLEDILRRLGGGFVMHSEVTDVPKGSGLGTSSILSAACVKAVFEFTGIEFTEEDLYLKKNTVILKMSCYKRKNMISYHRQNRGNCLFAVKLINIMIERREK